MALGDVLKPAGNMFGGAFARLARYSWILWVVLIFAALFAGFWIWKTRKDKESQWTHKLKIRRVLQNNLLSEPIIHRMRRFPIIQRAEVFELENPLLGGYLFPELNEYSGVNEYSIILDKNNRIYINKGEFFDKDKSSVNVSAKHAEIDIARSNLRADYQNINTIRKRVEWSTIAKFAFWSVFVLAVMVVSIVGIQEWGEAQSAKAQEASSMAQAMSNLAEAMETQEATANVQLILVDEIKELKGTDNLPGVIQNLQNETS